MDQQRLDALVQAVVARQHDDTPEQVVRRAEAFHAFLSASDQTADRA